MAKNKIILRRKNDDSEGDKYQYFRDYVNGVELTTPFKEMAKIITEGDEITLISKDWKAIKVNKSWICNECNSKEYTGSISEQDIQNLNCSNCGANEFHLTN